MDILKRLDERRQTVTDLSALLTLSKPTLLEHLEKLQAAGLVKRIDEGRKWIYYELSQKGRKLLHPEKVAIVLALSSAGVLAAVGGFLLLAVASGGLVAGPAAVPGNATMGSPSATQLIPGVANPVAAGGVVALILAAVAAGAALLLYWIGKRRRARFFSELAGA